MTTDSNHNQPVYESQVAREFEVQEKDTVYVGDITYIWIQEGWLHLAIKECNKNFT